MKGHEQLIQLRKSGLSPKIVFLNDYPCRTDWHVYGDHATISTDGDLLSSLDLRFLVGLTVSISALSESRAKAIFAKAKWFGAKTVAACHIDKSGKPWEQNGWAEVHHG